MLHENSFFRFVWRVNAVLVAVVCIGFLVLFGNGVRKWHAEKKQDSAVAASVAPGARATSEFGNDQGLYQLTNISPEMAGEEQLFALIHALGPDRDFVTDAFSPTAGMQTVNILAVNTISSEARWLFKGRYRTIFIQRALFETGREGSAVIGIVFEVVEQPFAGKAPKERHTLYAYTPDSGAAELVSADAFREVRQIGADKLLVICYEGSKGTAATFSVPAFKLLSRAGLPVLED